MTEKKKVLRSVYLDQDMDMALACRAEDEGVDKSELIRRFIRSGLDRPASILSGYAKGRRRKRARRTRKSRT